MIGEGDEVGVEDLGEEGAGGGCVVGLGRGGEFSQSPGL